MDIIILKYNMRTYEVTENVADFWQRLLELYQMEVHVL